MGQMQKTADINGGNRYRGYRPGLPDYRRNGGRRGAVWRGVLAVIVGSIIYRFIYAVVLRTGIVPIDCLKLVTAVIVALAIAMPSLKNILLFRSVKWLLPDGKEDSVMLTAGTRIKNVQSGNGK